MELPTVIMPPKPRRRPSGGVTVCEAEWGRIRSAVDHYREFLVVFDGLAPDKRPKQRERAVEAKRQMEVLGPQVPMVTLTLPPDAPKSTKVTLDNEPVEEASLGAALPVDPGDHRLTTQAPGGPPSEQNFHIEKAERQTIPLLVNPAAQPERPPPQAEKPPLASGDAPLASDRPADAPPGTGTGRVAAYVIGGVGVAGLIVGGVTGGLAASKKSAITDHCGEAVGSPDDSACDPIGLDAAESAKTMALTSDIALGIGVVGVVASAVLFATAPSGKPPTINTTGAVPSTSPHLTACSLSVDPTGATFGVRGAF